MSLTYDIIKKQNKTTTEKTTKDPKHCVLERSPIAMIKSK